MLELLLITISLFNEVNTNGADLDDPSNSYYCQQAISFDASMHDLVDNWCTNV